MIQYLKKRGRELVEMQRLTRGCWVNIAPPFSFEELDDIALSLKVPNDYLTDSLDLDERSRFEVEDEVKLIVLNTPVLNTVQDESAPLYITVPIGIVITPDHVVTISSYDNPVLEKFVQNKVRGFNPDDKSMFVLQLFEQNVHRFLSCLKDLNMRRDAIEQELYHSSRNRELLKLLSIEKSFVYFLTALSSNAMLKVKIQRVDLLGIKGDETKSDLLEDIITDINQAQSMANIYSNILSGTMDSVASIVSNNQNLFIQRLTLITVILMVPTLVASFFGMNVKVPFEGNAQWPFYAIMAASLVLAGGMVWIFRRNRML
jgi:magnesium transporter